MAETIAGGYYEDAPGSGTFHDANGKPVKKLSDRALKAARGKAAEMTDAQREALAAQRQAEQAALEAEEAAAKAGVTADAAAAGVKAADKAARKAAK